MSSREMQGSFQRRREPGSRGDAGQQQDDGQD